MRVRALCVCVCACVPRFVSALLCSPGATFDSFWRQLRAMSAAGDAWATATVSTIETMSPTSVKVACVRVCVEIAT
jgi:hypothetical protein